MQVKMIGDIPIHKLKQDYIRIKNSKQYIEEIEEIDPYDEDRHVEYWRKIKKKVIEGMWGVEPEGYRYCPSSLYFYANFCLIEDTDEAKNTVFIKPLIQDIEWEFALEYFEAEGFSGFYKDEEYTSDKLRLTWSEEDKPISFRQRMLYNSKGELKEYIHPHKAMRMLHEYPKGPPLFFNVAGNVSIMGSRGGGKSFFAALAKALHAIVTDGTLYYDEGKYYRHPDYMDELIGKKKPRVDIVLGSGDTDKSSELFSKIVAAMNALATEKEFGVWSSPEFDDYQPSPLYKAMAGSVKPGNKQNPWRHEYKVAPASGGREITKGSGSRINHVSYSEQKGKGKGAQAGAGGRNKYVIYEEQGLMGNLIEAMQSNNSVVSRKGIQFGVQAGIGTSGNIEAVQSTKKAFMNPEDYRILSHENTWEGGGKIGFFLPYYMTLRQFKDEDGNTDYEKAFEHVYKMRLEKAQSSDPAVLRIHKMNHPIVPSEMWITTEGHYLPHAEAVEREKQLIYDNKYLDLAMPLRLIWDSDSINGVKYEIDHEAEPFFTYPLPNTLQSFDSCIVAYDLPKFDMPNDFYFFTHDPYVSDNIDKGGSFGATHVIINPKYWDEYMPQTGPLVATWIAKPTRGLKAYYQEQEKLLAFYNSPIRGLAYESNRGADCKNYYINKNKPQVLALRPQVFDKKSVFLARVTEYGYVTTNVISDLDRLNDLLLREIPKIKKRFIETIPCLFTIQQIIQFNLKENFDAVSSLAVAPKHIGALEMEFSEKALKRKKQNELSFLSTNPFISKEKSNPIIHYEN